MPQRGHGSGTSRRHGTLREFLPSLHCGPGDCCPGRFLLYAEPRSGGDVVDRTDDRLACCTTLSCRPPASQSRTRHPPAKRAAARPRAAEERPPVCRGRHGGRAVGRCPGSGPGRNGSTGALLSEASCSVIALRATGSRGAPLGAPLRAIRGAICRRGVPDRNHRAPQVSPRMKPSGQGSFGSSMCWWMPVTQARPRWRG